MARSFLRPGTRRVVGGLFVAAGILLALGLIIRLALLAYAWGSADNQPYGLLLLNMLALVAAGLMIRYGRQLVRGGGLSDGPADETML
jgi:hypothetical protein